MARRTRIASVVKAADGADGLKKRVARTMRIIWGEHPFCHSERSRGISNSKQRSIRDVSTFARHDKAAHQNETTRPVRVRSRSRFLFRNQFLKTRFIRGSNPRSGGAGGAGEVARSTGCARKTLPHLLATCL